jgi:Flp pilus assembly protein TadD
MRHMARPKSAKTRPGTKKPAARKKPAAPKRTAAKKKPAAKTKPAAKKKPAAAKKKPAAAKKKPAPAKKPAAAKKKPAAAETPPTAPQLIDRALAEAGAGDFEQAATLMLEAARLAPADWRLPNEAGIFYYRLERYDDAVRCYDQALRLVPGDVAVMMNKALAYILSDRDEEGRAVLHEITTIDPIYAPAYFELGKLHQKAGELQDAIEYFDTALFHETSSTLFNMTGAPPRNDHLISLVLLNKARIMFQLDREADGVGMAQTLWNTVGDDHAIVKLANELADGDRRGAARRVIDVLIAAQPDHAEAVALRARIAPEGAPP